MVWGMDEANREGVSQVNAEEEEASSSGYRLVPWQSWEEWNMIREKVLSSSPESVGIALNRRIATVDGTESSSKMIGNLCFREVRLLCPEYEFHVSP